MKIHIKNPENFNSETVEYYENFAELTSEKECDIIVVNNFTPIETDKIVACNSTATEHIKAKEIISLRGEDLSDITAVAELTLGMMVMVIRLFKGEEIKGKTLGLIGRGRICIQFAEMALNMGMSVNFYDKKDSNKTLKNLLEESDVVSLHITADEENRNWFDRAKFKRMKNGAVFLNSARPWLVEEGALRWALNNKLSACWIDFEMPFQHPKLVITNHQGGNTVESKAKTELIIASKVEQYKLKNKHG